MSMATDTITMPAGPPAPSRRALFGAGAALLAGGALSDPGFLKPPPLPWRNGPRPPHGADAKLLQLCADLAEWDGKREQRDREFWAGVDFADDELDTIMVPWWDAIEAITETPARTREGVIAKAAAVRMGFEGTYGDDAPTVTALLGSLLTDILGGPVRLPGADLGDMI